MVYLMEGQKEININYFEKQNRVGLGQYGTVFKVTSKIDKNTYAAKILKYESENNESEIKIMSMTKHPTIIKYIGYSSLDFNGDNNFTILMEFAKNGSLADILKKIRQHKTPKNYNNTIRQIILTGVSRGMKYLHDNHIIHRDLKPGNILLDDNLYPHITDFGISKFSEFCSSFSNSSVGGTPAYMAPELIGSDRYDEKIDVYAFGIVMYEIVTNLFPYPEYENKQDFPKFRFFSDIINNNKRPKLDSWGENKSLKQLIKQCWSNDPQERPSFDEIYKKLSDLKSQQYFLKDVNLNQFKFYLDSINGHSNPRRNKYSPVKKAIKEEPVFKEEEVLASSVGSENDINFLREKMAKILKENKLLKTKNDEYLKENNQLKTKKDEYLKEIKQLKMKIEEYLKDIKQLTIKSDEYLKEISKLQSKNNSIEEENQLLKNIHDSMKTEVQPPKPSASIFSKNIRKQIFIPTIKTVKPAAESRPFDDNILISEFNGLPLKNQQTVSDKISKLGFSECNSFFKKLNNLLLHLAANYEDLTESCVEIDNEERERLNDITKDRLVHLRYNVVEALYRNNSFNSIINIINEFDEVGFQIKYPSYSYERMCNYALKLVDKNRNKYRITVLITGTDNIDFEFQNNKSINYIQFDSKQSINLTEIYSNSFKGCTSLLQINLPSSVSKIKSNAFEGCSSLRKIKIPSSLTVIESSVFEGCSSLSQIEIPSSITRIESKAFKGCISLTKLVIPDSVEEIKFHAFMGCSSLAEVAIPNSITKIEAGIFDGCSSLRFVTIPKSVKEIGKSSFEGCSSMTRLNIPSSVTKIKSFAFKGCILLRLIQIPSTIDEFDNGLFKGCKSLTTIKIPESVITIKPESFKDCTSLIEVSIPSNVREIGRSTFECCSSLYKVTFPDGLTKICSDTFKDCKALKEIEIPSSVVELESGAFEGCSSLTDFRVPSSVTKIGSSCFSKCSSLVEFSIPSSVNSIGIRVFKECNSLVKVSIPSSISSIRDEMFMGCTSLNDIKIPDSVTFIGRSAFQDCSSLEHLDIPKSVESIQKYAFDGCKFY